MILQIWYINISLFLVCANQLKDNTVYWFGSKWNIVRLGKWAHTLRRTRGRENWLHQDITTSCVVMLHDIKSRSTRRSSRCLNVIYGGVYFMCFAACGSWTLLSTRMFQLKTCLPLPGGYVHLSHEEKENSSQRRNRWSNKRKVSKKSLKPNSRSCQNRSTCRHLMQTKGDSGARADFSWAGISV